MFPCQLFKPNTSYKFLGEFTILKIMHYNIILKNITYLNHLKLNMITRRLKHFKKNPINLAKR